MNTMKKIGITSTYIEEFDVYVNTYMTLSEVELIAKKMMLGKTYTEEILIRDNLIVKLLTNITDEEGDDYDYLVNSGLMDKILNSIKNLHLIDEYINHARNTSFAVITFLNTLSKNLDKYGKKLPSTIELKEMLKEIKDIELPLKK